MATILTTKKRWDVQEVNPTKLHIHLYDSLKHILSGNPEDKISEETLTNGQIKSMLEQVVLFWDTAGSTTLDALVANLRNAVFEYANQAEPASAEKEARRGKEET